MSRTAEGQFYLDEDLHWSMEQEIIHITWRDMKTGKLYTIPIPDDSADWNLSFYNAVACLRIVGNGDRYFIN